MEKDAPANTPDIGDNQEEEVQFHPRELHQIMHEYNCDYRQRVYYTGPQDDKDYLEDIMNRVKAYLKYSCARPYGFVQGYRDPPGMIILPLKNSFILFNFRMALG